MAKKSKDAKDSGLSDDEKIVKKAKERYKRGRDSQSDENNRYRHNTKFTYIPDYQWPDAIKKQREIDLRPVLTVNRQPVFVRSIVNQYKQNPSAIKVLPADDGADKEVAEIFTGMIRNIETQCNSSQIKGNALGCAVAGNKGFFRFITEYEPMSFTQEIKFLPIVNPLAVTYDCDDTSLDGSGWRWCFVEEELTEDEFDSQFPEADRESWPTDSQSDWSMDDGKKIRVAEYFYKEDVKTTICLLDSGEVVEKTDLQPDMVVVDEREAMLPKVRWCKLGGNAKKPLEKKEWAGQYIPIVPVWGDQIWENGKRRLLSALEFSHDSQKMVNFWRSTETELLSLQNKAPFVGTNEQFENHPEWAQANSTNLPFLPYTHVNGVPPPQRQGFAAPPSGVLAASQNAAQDLMDTSGIQEAGLGMQSNETSGKAINARAAQTQNSVYHFIDNMKHADRYAGMILVDLIPKINDTPKVVRTLGIDGTEEMKKVNQPVEEKDSFGQVIKKFYDLSAGKYDVIVTSGPSFSSKRQEGAELISQIAQGNPEVMAKAGDILFKALDIPYAEEIAERLKKYMPPEIVPKEGEEQQMPPELKMQFDQMQQAMQQMDAVIQEQAKELENKEAEFALKSRELDIKEKEADAKIAQALQPAGPVVQVDAEVEPELSEADKLEIEIERELAKEERQHQREKEKEILRAKLAKGDELLDVDENGEEKPSLIAEGITSLIQGQQMVAQALEANTQQTAQLAAVIAAPKEVIRDEKGKVVGVKPV